MKHEKKFKPKEQHQVSEVQQTQQTAKEFASVEEMLRHDAAQTQVPAAVTGRLNESLAKESSHRPRSWWRWLRGDR